MTSDSCCHVPANVCRFLQRTEVQLGILQLLIQLLPYVIYLGDGAIYRCNSRMLHPQIVENATAELTNGCILDGTNKDNFGITFDLEAMYKAANPNAPVVINIRGSTFINCYIKLINAHLIAGWGTAGPLEFTMTRTLQNVNTFLEFGSNGQLCKFPPNSRIHISENNIDVKALQSRRIYMFTFHSLQLVDNSTMEINLNVIYINCRGCEEMIVFRVQGNNEMMISDKSSFILRNNAFTMSGDSSNSMNQIVWSQDATSLTISNAGNYKWELNTIRMKVRDISNYMKQYIWFQGTISHLNISDTSNYIWSINTIIMNGESVANYIHQQVWTQSGSSTLTISLNSTYTWVLNIINLFVSRISVLVHQYLWLYSGTLTISYNSNYTCTSNNITMVVELSRFTTVRQFVWDQASQETTQTISYSSLMVWRDNCVGMGTNGNQIYNQVFRCRWTVITKGALLLIGNYFTTTEKFIPSAGNLVTQYLWGTIRQTPMTINTGGSVTILNTTVHGNNGTSGAAYSMVWNNSLTSYTSNVDPIQMEWSPSPAVDAYGSLIPLLNIGNFQRYMCGIRKSTPIITPVPTVPHNATPTVPRKPITTVPHNATPTVPREPITTVPSKPITTVSRKRSAGISRSLTEIPNPIVNHCYEVTDAPNPTYVTISDLFTNGAVFEFTVSRPLPSDGGKLKVVVQALLLGEGNAPMTLVAKCHTAQRGLHGRYTCRFPLPPASLPTGNVSSIFLRYMPSPETYCPLGIATVWQALSRAAANLSVAAFVPVCPVMTNTFTDGSVFVILASCPCAPESSKQGAKVAMNLITPFGFLGDAAGVFGNICLTVFPWAVGAALLYGAKYAKWDIIIDHPILKHTVGFRATLIGMGFWLAELTYPGVVVGTFGMIRAGDNINIGLGAVGCVYLVMIPVMAVVVVGPLRSRYVTYDEIYVGSHQLGYGMCHSLLVPQGMWGGTGPALGPVTQPFAGIRKAAWCAPLSYIVMFVVGAVLHGMGRYTSCVTRLATVSVLLGVVGLLISATRPLRYHINSLLYAVTFDLLAIYTALLAITAACHDVAQNSQEECSDIVMGFVQLAVGVSICIVFLVRGAVFVVILIKEGYRY